MKKKIMALAILCVMVFCLALFGSSPTSAAEKTLDELKAEVRAKYGVKYFFYSRLLNQSKSLSNNLKNKYYLELYIFLF